MKHPFVKSLLVTLAVLFSVFFLAPPIQAQAPGADGSQDNLQTDGAAENPADDGVTCSIEKIGWILCPIIEGAAFIGDNAFSVLAGNFLEIEPALVANDENGTRGVWEIFRNIANIMFIIAFMVIIYSQITGAGLSNYGIKKMLPRVIFAAILVNISYYICQGMVDISNAGGYIIKDMLTDLAGQISNRAAMPIGGVSGAFAEGGTLSAIAVGALALGGAVYLLLPILMPVVGLVVITAFIIIVILLLRKAIVIMLVVLSPIAFVAYLLPNTEKFFSKWLHMFWQLLMVFPVVGLLFGAGQLTSAVVLAAGSNGGATSTYATEGEQCVTLPLVDQSNAASDPTAGASTGPCGEGSTTMTLGLVAAGIAIAPLLAVWSVLQGALSAAGAVGGKMAGVVSKFGDSRKKSRQDDIGRRRQAITDRREMNAMRNPKSIRGYSARKRARRGAVQSGIKEGRQRAEQDYIASQMLDENKEPTRLAEQAAGANILGRGADDSAVQRSLARSLNIAEKAEHDDMSAIQAQYRAQGISGDESKLADKLQEAVENGDKAGAKAAQDMMLQLGAKGAKAFVDKIEHMETHVGAFSANKGGAATSLRDNVAQNHSALKSSDADIYAWGSSSGTIGSSAAGAYSNLTNDQLATQSNRSLTNASAQTALSQSEKYVYTDPADGKSKTSFRQRKESIIASDAGKNIKAENKGFF